MKTVLVIEDDAACRHIVSVRLRRHGCRLLEASDGVEGLKTALRERPDLILLDLALPGLDGGEVLARLRREPQTAQTPVIVITAQNGRERVLQIVRHGVAGYLVKPFEGALFDREVGRQLAIPVFDPGERPVVLVVDPSEETCREVRRWLEPIAYVVGLGSGEEALDRFDSIRPAVILVALELTGVTAADVVKHVRWFKPPGCRLVGLAHRAGLPHDAAGCEAVLDRPLVRSRLMTHVLAAANVTPAGLVRQLVEEVDRCPVLTVPSARWDALGRLPAQLAAELDRDHLILDVSAIGEASVALASLVAAVARVAEDSGVRLAVSATAGVGDVLRMMEETRRIPCATGIPAARALLRAAAAA